MTDHCCFAVVFIILTKFLMVMGGKLLILNSNIADVDALKIKIDPILLRLQSFQDLHNYIGIQRKLRNESFRLERLDNKSGKYFQVEYDNEILWNFNHITILVIQTTDVESSQLYIQGRTFNLSKGLSIGSFGYKLRISELEFASLGTGLNIWDGSIVLAKYLESQPDLIRNKRVLELGAGTGVAGIAAGLLGASSILLTDLEYTLANLKRNADENFCQMAPTAPITSPNSVISSKDQYSSSLEYRVAALDWADRTTYPANCNGADKGTPPFDVILGAGIVWLEHLVPLLVNTLVACMSEHTVLLLSHQTRSERTDKVLFGSLNKYFDISKVDKDTYPTEFQSTKISIYSGILKKS